MLGLSLFNFGAAWRKSGQGETFKRAKQIRTKEKEELKPDAKAVMDIAEQEANSVIKETREQMTVQQLEETQRTSATQMVLRYGAIGAWAVAAGLFFTSMIFNYPFALGKGFLSLLPGIPHVATLSLEAENRFVSIDKNILVRLKLDTNEEKIKALNARILFDSEKLDFLSYEPDEIFDRFSLSRSGQGVLDLELILADDKETEFGDAAVASLNFAPKAGEGIADIKLQQDESRVYANKENELKNILGKAEDTSIRLVLPEKTRAYCYSINFDPIIDSKDNWQAFGMGTILPGEETKWTGMDENLALACGHDGQKAFFLVSTGASDTVSSLSILNDGRKNSVGQIENIAKWTGEKNNFIVIPIAKEELAGRQVEIDFNLESGDSVHWPKKGVVGFEFK